MNLIVEKINKVIKDFQDWKNKLDKKFDIYIQFLNNLYNLEKYYFDDALNKFDKQKNNFNKDIFYDYESLIGIKEIYRINNNIKKFLHDYNNKTNFSKLSYFFINKLAGINLWYLI